MNWVYILRCKDGSLYTGWTNNLEKRIENHATGKGAKYTRGRCPLTLVYYEQLETKQQAMAREMAVKRLTKKQKEELVKHFVPE